MMCKMQNGAKILELFDPYTIYYTKDPFTLVLCYNWSWMNQIPEFMETIGIVKIWKQCKRLIDN